MGAKDYNDKRVAAGWQTQMDKINGKGSTKTCGDVGKEIRQAAKDTYVTRVSSSQKSYSDEDINRIASK